MLCDASWRNGPWFCSVKVVMPMKKVVLFFAILAIVGCIVSYRLGTAPIAHAKPRSTPEETSSLPTAPPTWTITGASTYKQPASVTRPAGGTGVQHVVMCIAFSMNSGSPGKVSSTAILRNGPSGTGTPLWQYNFTLEPGTSVDHSVCGLNIVGSADTDMTLETSAYGSTVGSFVNLVGYDAQ